jgi:hypothetical protein
MSSAVLALSRQRKNTDTTLGHESPVQLVLFPEKLLQFRAVVQMAQQAQQNVQTPFSIVNPKVHEKARLEPGLGRH